jgi:hypothetical protein
MVHLNVQPSAFTALDFPEASAGAGEPLALGVRLLARRPTATAAAAAGEVDPGVASRLDAPRADQPAGDRDRRIWVGEIADRVSVAAARRAVGGRGLIVGAGHEAREPAAQRGQGPLPMLNTYAQR